MFRFRAVPLFVVLCAPSLAMAQPAPTAVPSAPTPMPSPIPTGALGPDDEKLLKEIEGEARATRPASPPPTAPSGPGAGLSNLYNPAIALNGLFAAAAFSESERPEPGAHDPQGTGFTLQNLELTLSANVDAYLRGDAHVIFTLEGVEVEEAYLTTLTLPGSLQVKAGQAFTPFGRQNKIHPHGWQFVDQNLVNVLLFGGDGLRNPGASLSWLAPLPVYTELLGAVVHSRGETAVSFLGETPEGVEERPIDSADDLVYLGKLSLSFPIGPSLTVLGGVSGLAGPNPTAAYASTRIAGGDLYVKVKPASAIYAFGFLQAEVMAREYELADADVQRDEGFYAMAGARVSRRLEVAVRGESVRSDRLLDPEALPWRNRFAGQVTFRPSEFSKLRLQGNYDVLPQDADPILGGMLQWEFLIGAHGAHAF